MTILRWAALLSLGTLAACSMFQSNKPPLPGERQTILTQETVPTADLTPEALAQAPHRHPTLGDTQPALWTVEGGAIDHAPAPVGFKAEGQRLYDLSMRAVSTSAQNFQQVLIGAEHMYALDAKNTVVAWRRDDHTQAWSYRPKMYADAGMVGGIALHEDALIVTTSEGRVVGLNTQTGEVLWSVKLRQPLRGSPTFAQDIVLQQTKDNKLFGLSVTNGETQWMFDVPPESLSFLSGANPAVIDGKVLTVMTSGDIIFLRGDNGAVLWRDKIDTQYDRTEISLLTDIQALPVLDATSAYLFNLHGLTAFDHRQGKRKWSLPLRGSATPYATQAHLFVVDDRGYLYCVEKATGAILWRTQLGGHDTPEDAKSVTNGAVFGPFVTQAGVMVIRGTQMALFDLATGAFLRSSSLKSPPVISPSFTDDHMFVLDTEANLVVYT